MTPRDADVPFGASLLSDAANPERIIFRRGDCNEAILLNAHWGDIPRWVGAAFFVFGISVMQCLLWWGVMYVMGER